MATTRTRKKARSPKQIAATKKLVAMSKAKAARKKAPKKAAKKSAKSPKRAPKKAAKKTAKSKNPYAKRGSTSLLAKRYGAVKTIVLSPTQANVLGKLMRSHDCRKEGGVTVCKTRKGHVKAVLHSA
jgi:hypothetical protein